MSRLSKLGDVVVRCLLDARKPSYSEIKGALQRKSVSTINVVKEKPEVFYPPQATGVKLATIQQIINSNTDLLDMAISELGLPDIHAPGFNPNNLTDKNRRYNAKTLVRDVAENALAYIHLLPASENHHHAEVGGLARHSLEVALYSLRHITTLELPQTRFTDEMVIKKARWHYAAWVTGIIHDIGKALYDITVLGPNDIWNPLTENLIDWAKRTDVEKYEITWKYSDRHGKHTGLASLMLNNILTKEAKDFLFSVNDELQIDIQDALQPLGEPNNPLRLSLKKGEARSVHHDMMLQWDRIIGGRKTTIETAFIKRLQMMRRAWTINQPKGDIWCVGPEDVFLQYSVNL
ncbi:MAG: TraI domain-containing protein [Shewanella fodinae]|nr:TraI domain-containing protein [Shewanella fodinae]